MTGSTAVLGASIAASAWAPRALARAGARRRVALLLAERLEVERLEELRLDDDPVFRRVVVVSDPYHLLRARQHHEVIVFNRAERQEAKGEGEQTDGQRAAQSLLSTYSIRHVHRRQPAPHQRRREEDD